MQSVAASPAVAPAEAAVSARTRISSIDAFRGLVMFLLMAEVMRLWKLVEAFPDSRFWSLVAFHTTHVPWQGCSLDDLVQAGLSFLAGVILFPLLRPEGEIQAVRAAAEAGS